MILKVLNRGIGIIGRFLSSFRGHSIFDGVAAISKVFDKAINNVNFDIKTNGELRVIKLLDMIKPKCIFDVGANIGDWSNLVSSIYPECEVHAFEIVPATFEELKKNVRATNIKLSNIGLSDKEEMINIHVSSRESTTATSCKIEGMEAHDQYYSSEYQCKTIMGFQYVAYNDINAIDFLKIDVEGMDYRVIAGFGEYISNIKVIQFEYGVFNISSKDLLIDFYRLLIANGFVTGKIYPKGVMFSEYHFKMEDFYGNNYLAVRQDQRELISLLSI